MNVAIVDYGSGNLHSARKAFERAAREAGLSGTINVTRDPDAVFRADRIVLPGVGAFADCRRGLDAVPGMVAAMTAAVCEKARPFLGICVGMQLLATRGLEYQTTPGLGWIGGDVEPIDSQTAACASRTWAGIRFRRQACIRFSPGSRPGRRACTPISCTPMRSSPAPRLRHSGDRLRRSNRRVDRARQHRRNPVPSGKESGARPRADRQFSEVAAVILFPAIDLKQGQCVRLQQGDMARATIFNEDPAAQALAFARQGFEYLHVVDLDGAFAGRPVNAAAVEAILAAVKIPLQLGGGIRDIDGIEAWLGKGVARVIMGTPAVRDPDLVRRAARLYPGRIAVGIDARDGKVAVEGWAKTSSFTAAELGKRFEDAGVAAIVYTDIARDGGLLKGLNIEATLALADALKIPVIASGGLASLADVERLLMLDCAKLEGAIAGRALYDGRLDPAQALSLIRLATAPA